MLKPKNILIVILKNVIISIVFIVSISVIIFFIKKETEKITDAIALNTKLESRLKMRTELLETIDRDSKIIGNNELLINNAYIPSNNISPFINKLDDLTTVSGIIQNYRFDTPTRFNEESPYPLSVISYTNNLTTNVSNFSIYLKNFENLQYFTQIESINISSQDPLGWDGLSNISYKAKLHTKHSE